MNTPKPIVFFGNVIYLKQGYRAELSRVTGHPNLGDVPWVSTSKVVDIRDDGDTIETLNTIYKKMTG